MHLLLNFLFIHSCVFVVAVIDTPPFDKIPDSIFENRKNIRIGGFTDLDADKRTDLLTISTSENVLRVLYSASEDSTVRGSDVLHLEDAANLTTVVPADFDGDLITDFLLIYGTVGDVYRLELCFGSGSASATYKACQNVTHSRGEPIIIDYNGDMKPDILLENPGGNMTLLLSDMRNFSSQAIGSGLLDSLLHPHSSAFVDLNRDLAADIALTTTKGLIIKPNKDGGFNLESSSCTISWPDKVPTKDIGMTSFLDYDADSYMDVIVSSTDKQRTTIYVIPGKLLTPWLEGGCEASSAPSWNKLPIDLVDGFRHGWKLSPHDSWLRAGDVDNDGYIDLLVTLVNVHTGAVHPFIMLNADCNDSCTDDVTRSFTAMWSWLPVDVNITQAAFYDVYHDGMLDVLYNTEATLHLFHNNVAKLSCFVSVKVGSGLCAQGNDASCTRPYTNIVGPTIQYNSTHPDGTSAYGIATQLPQSTNKALQIPYIQFGLGTTPNFVDSLTVGVARQKDQESWTETWKTIIPNSHLVVVPRPPRNPDKWLMHLYVTPSHLVLVTGLILLGLCAFIAVLIAILHLKEKYHDKKVKLQEAHRFHFNAM